MTAQETEFIKKNGYVWKELEQKTLLFKSRKKKGILSPSSFSREDADRMVSLYNDTANHLAYVRTYIGECETEEYLNRILSNAHAVIYSENKFGFRRFIDGIARGIPRLFRSKAGYFAVSAALFILSFLVAYVFTVIDVRNCFAFVDPATASALREEGMYDEFHAGVSALETAYIGQNNIIICLECFAGGITFGLFTGYVLVTNGLLLGALAGIFHSKGTALFFWSLILPHGVTELFAIMLSGAAGFMIAWALIAPGKISRKNALIINGGHSIRLMLLTVVLLVISAVIEGYITPLEAESPYLIKYFVAALMAVLLGLYLLLPGRNRNKTNQKEKLK